MEVRPTHSVTRTLSCATESSSAPLPLPMQTNVLPICKLTGTMSTSRRSADALACQRRARFVVMDRRSETPTRPLDSRIHANNTIRFSAPFRLTAQSAQAKLRAAYPSSVVVQMLELVRRAPSATVALSVGSLVSATLTSFAPMPITRLCLFHLTRAKATRTCTINGLAVVPMLFHHVPCVKMVVASSLIAHLIFPNKVKRVLMISLH